MMCDKLQALDIKKKKTRDPKKIAQIRRAMREHVQKCALCQKRFKRIPRLRK